MSVAPPGRAGTAAALTAEVPAGGVVDFATPIPPEGRAPGSVTISSESGAPIVAARVTTRSSKRALEELDATSGSAGPSDEWLLPGAAVARGVRDVLTLANPGTRGTTVTLLELPSLTARTVRPSVLSLPAGSRVAIALASVLTGAPAFAVQVSATVPILAEQAFTPGHGLTTSVAGIPVGR